VENIAGSSISPKLYSANKGGLPFAMAQREGMPLFKGQGRCKLANAGEYPTQKKKAHRKLYGFNFYRLDLVSITHTHSDFKRHCEI
jgi:hypothetical protein